MCIVELRVICLEILIRVCSIYVVEYDEEIIK